MSNIVYREGLTFREILSAIDASAAGAVAVVDDDMLLVGLVTDGDIRRALLRGESINSPASSAVNFHPKTYASTADPNKINEFFALSGVRHLPLVDADNRFVNLLVRDLPQNEDVPVLVMAGGRGKRLAPLTDTCPKPMLKLGEKPMLEHILHHLKLEGFRRVYISVNYLRDVIIDYFGDGSAFGLDIRYVPEDEPLGTGGALGLIEDRDFESIMVINGDVITDSSYNDIVTYHQKSNASVTTVVAEAEHTVRFGVVETHGLNVLNIKEKPRYLYFINVGCYVFSSDALKYFTRGQYSDIPNVLNAITQAGDRVVINHTISEWRDLGTVSDYKALCNRYES